MYLPIISQSFISQYCILYSTCKELKFCRNDLFSKKICLKWFIIHSMNIFSYEKYSNLLVMPSPLLFRLNILLYTKVFANLFTIHKQSKQKKERKKTLTIIEKRRKNALSVDFFFLSWKRSVRCSLR